MVQIYIVNNDDKYELDNINVFSSIYNLKQKFKNTYNKRIKNNNIKTNKELLNKIKNNEFYFTYKGQRLDDDKTLYQYNIKNSSMIDINYLLPGGKKGMNISSFIKFFFYLFLIIFFYMMMSSGLISFFAKIYGYSVAIILEKTFEFIFWFFGKKIEKNSSLNILLKFIENIIIFFSLGIFIYIFIFFINYVITDIFLNKCKSLKNSKIVSRISIIVFFIFYILFQLPNFLLKGTEFILDTISSKTKAGFLYLSLKSFRNILEKLRNTFNTFKYKLLIIMPFGKGMGLYYEFLNSIFKSIDDIRDKISVYDNKDGKKRIIDCKKDENDILKILKNNKDFRNVINQLNLTDSSNIEKYYKYILDVKNKSYNNILYNDDVSNDEKKINLSVKLGYYLVCNILKLSSIFTRSLDTIGSSSDIVDMIMTSSISGSLTLIVNTIGTLIKLIF